MRRAQQLQNLATRTMVIYHDLLESEASTPRYRSAVLQAANALSRSASAILDLKRLPAELSINIRKVGHYKGRELARSTTGVLHIRRPEDIPEQVMSPVRARDEILHRIAGVFVLQGRLLDRATKFLDQLDADNEAKPHDIVDQSNELTGMTRVMRILLELWVKHNEEVGPTEGLPFGIPGEAPESPQDIWDRLKEEDA